MNILVLRNVLVQDFLVRERHTKETLVRKHFYFAIMRRKHTFARHGLTFGLQTSIALERPLHRHGKQQAILVIKVRSRSLSLPLQQVPFPFLNQ